MMLDAIYAATVNQMIPEKSSHHKVRDRAAFMPPDYIARPRDKKLSKQQQIEQFDAFVGAFRGHNNQ